MILKYAFEKLKVDTLEMPLIVTAPSHYGKELEAKLYDFFFENFGNPGCSVSISPKLTLYSSGKHTGL